VRQTPHLCETLGTVILGCLFVLPRRTAHLTPRSNQNSTIRRAPPPEFSIENRVSEVRFHGIQNNNHRHHNRHTIQLSNQKMWLITRPSRNDVVDDLEVSGHRGVIFIDSEKLDSSNRTTPLLEDEDTSQDTPSPPARLHDRDEYDIETRHTMITTLQSSQNAKTEEDLPSLEESCSSSLTELECATTPQSSLLPFEQRVRFGTVEIREYARCASDNPSVTCGVPVGLDWKVVAHHGAINVDEYESKRQEQCRRSPLELRMTSMERQEVLRKNCGYSLTDVKDLELSVRITRKQRQATVSGLHRQMSHQLFVSRLQKAMRPWKTS
jgi:hypothetical protein